MKKIAGILILIPIFLHCSAFRAVIFLKEGSSKCGKNSAAEVKFRTEGHLIIIRALIGDSARPYNFILDTGALNVLDKNLARDLNLAGKVHVAARDTSGRTRDVELVRIKKIRIGDAEITDASAAVMDLGVLRGVSRTKIDGIIGSNSLMFFSTFLNYGEGVLILRCGKVSARERHGIPFKKDITHGFAPRFRCILNGSTTIDAIIDTGFSGYLKIPLSRYQKIDPSGKFLIRSKGVVSGGIFGTTGRNYLARIESFAAGGKKINDLPVQVSEDIDTALIGRDFLSQFRIEIDYPNGELFLDEINGARFKDNIFSAGLFLIRDKRSKIIIGGIYDNSPAGEQGLEIGDEVDRINSRAAEEYSVLELQTILNDDRITSLKLSVRNDKGRKIILLKKRPLFEKIKKNGSP